MFSRELEIIKNFDKKLENENFSTQRCLYWKIPNKNCYGKGRMVTKVSEVFANLFITNYCSFFFIYITLLAIYGSFRHWGHRCHGSLNNLERKVNMDKKMEGDYAEALTSDLALKVIEKEFNKTGTYSVRDPSHVLYKYISRGKR